MDFHRATGSYNSACKQHSCEMLQLVPHHKHLGTTLVRNCAPPLPFPQATKTPPLRGPSDARSQQTRIVPASLASRFQVSAAADRASTSMTAQVDAESKIPIQEMVDLAVVWASQHGLVQSCALATGAVGRWFRSRLNQSCTHE